MPLTKDSIVGDWELGSFEQAGPEGELIRSHPSSEGILIYSPGGMMSVSMFRVPDTSNPDIERNFVRDLYYAGTYTVEGDRVLHHVKVALGAQHRSQVLSRRGALSEDGKILVLEVLSVEERVIASIVWNRVPSISPKLSLPPRRVND